VTNLWIESEFILISLVPIKLHDMVTRIHQSERRSLVLINNGISDDKFILHVLWEAFEGDRFRITFTNDDYLVLLVGVV
jgi:hypothetical protein